jgi:hypothetical protein
MALTISYFNSSGVRTEKVWLLPVAEKRARQAVHAGHALSAQVRDNEGRLVFVHPRLADGPPKPTWHNRKRIGA